MRPFNNSINLTDARDAKDARDARDATDAVDAKWFAVQTKPKAEEKAISFLSLKSVPTFLPRLLVRRRHGSRRWQALEPLFPSYLFAKFAPEPRMIDSVRWTPGVRKVLGDEEAPISVPEEVVEFLLARVSQRGFILPGQAFAPGMKVRFKGGPLAYLEGIIERPASRAERVRVLLELLNQRVSVEVDINELERA